MSKLNKLVFFGNERLATGLSSTDAPTLKALLNAGYEIPVVVSNYTEGKSRNARPLEIAEVAKQHNIPVLLPKKTKDIKNEIKSYGAEAGILVAYGKIIPSDVIDVFPKGIINIHPSLLPKYRGPTPIEQTVLDGITITGVSLMQLAAKMDAGPIFAQSKVTLSGKETKAELAQGMLNLGAKLLIENLPNILSGNLKSSPQDESQATYTKLLDKKDGKIDWSKSANTYEREVRAYAGYPKSTAKIEDYDVIITKAHATTRPYDFKGIIRHCKDGSTLEIDELIAPSGRTMSGADFVIGYFKKD